MSHVACLLADPERTPLDQATVAALERALGAPGPATDPGAAALAAGHGANDLPMLRAAGLGVAFRSTRPVAQLAPVIIRWDDLTALLYLPGVPKSDFVAGRESL